MPSSTQLLALPNLQRNLLHTFFLETPSRSQLIKSHAIVRNSPAIKDTTSLFHTYIAFCDYYAEKPPPYDEHNWAMGQIVLDLCAQVLDLLSDLGFCGILATLLPEPDTEAIERVICSLPGPNLVVYTNSSNSSKLSPMPPIGDSLGPHPSNGNGSPSTPSDHSCSPTFNIRNSTLWDLSALAAQISGALMEGRASSQWSSSSISTSPTPIPIPTPCIQHYPWALACYSCREHTHLKVDCPQYICPICNTTAPGHKQADRSFQSNSTNATKNGTF